MINRGGLEFFKFHTITHIKSKCHIALFFFSTPLYLSMLERYPYYYRKGNIKTLQPLSSPSMSDVSSWVSKMSQIKYFNDYRVYLFGSLSQGYSNPTDMDILFTGGEYDPAKLSWLLDMGLNIGMNEIGVNTDTFYIPDISYLDLPFAKPLGEGYSIYTSYDYVVEAMAGELKVFRDYQKNYTNGLFEFKHTGNAQKAVMRGYVPSKHILLN
jgi:hypothetical protein